MLGTTYARDLPEIVVNNQGGKHSEFSTIEWPNELWGHSETEGTCRQRSYALAHAHLLKFQNLDSKNKKTGLGKTR